MGTHSEPSEGTDAAEVTTTRSRGHLTLRPPRRAFVLAYVSVVVGGLLGAAIGAGLVDVLCRGDCTLNIALGAVAGATFAAGGVAVVAVLVLRAMAEWNTEQARKLAEQADREASPPQPPTC